MICAVAPGRHHRDRGALSQPLTLIVLVVVIIVYRQIQNYIL
jgi:hypothetical protein